MGMVSAKRSGGHGFDPHCGSVLIANRDTKYSFSPAPKNSCMVKVLRCSTAAMYFLGKKKKNKKKR
ncbi:hypothetical protein DPMN_095011 [Dreissena polymorpha]|uniref:Uncharacterized protein n=1 Tax=Dreissena polymorpha TaxID=45954 RepID=A0A9D4L6K3_DREPO|nr:hypothetical protein DPMN_095011 [Dreissena polymorpha]